MMIYYEDSNSTNALVKTGKEVHVGDYMIDLNGSKMEVTSIENIWLGEKVYVETESGTGIKKRTGIIENRSRSGSLLIIYYDIQSNYSIPIFYA